LPYHNVVVGGGSCMLCYMCHTTSARAWLTEALLAVCRRHRPKGVFRGRRGHGP